MSTIRFAGPIDELLVMRLDDRQRRSQCLFVLLRGRQRFGQFKLASRSAGWAATLAAHCRKVGRRVLAG